MIISQERVIKMKKITLLLPDKYFDGFPDEIKFGEDPYLHNSYGKFEKGRRLLWRALRSVIDISKVIPEMEAEYKQYKDANKMLYWKKKNLTSFLTMSAQKYINDGYTPESYATERKKRSDIVSEQEKVVESLCKYKDKFNRWSRQYNMDEWW